jgi:hypothetical protein
LTKRTLLFLVENDIAAKLKMLTYFSKANTPDYSKLMSIPVTDRVPELSKKMGVENMGKIIMAEVTKFQNCFNVIRPMNAFQIAECAYAIIQSAEEDYLSLEDLILFFAGAKQSKYGKVYDRLDQQVIFEMLEVYRQERHATYLAMKEEQHSNHKSAGINERFVSEAMEFEKNETRKAIGEYLRQTAKPNE